MPIGCRFFIARITSRWREGLIAEDRDLADLDLGAFNHVEDHFERGGRNAAQFRSRRSRIRGRARRGVP